MAQTTLPRRELPLYYPPCAFTAHWNNFKTALESSPLSNFGHLRSIINQMHEWTNANAPPMTAAQFQRLSGLEGLRSAIDWMDSHQGSWWDPNFIPATTTPDTPPSTPTGENSTPTPPPPPPPPPQPGEKKASAGRKRHPVTHECPDWWTQVLPRIRSLALRLPEVWPHSCSSATASSNSATANTTTPTSAVASTSETPAMASVESTGSANTKIHVATEYGVRVLQAGSNCNIVLSSAACLSLLATSFFCNIIDYTNQQAFISNWTCRSELQVSEWGNLDWFALFGSRVDTGIERIKCFLALFYLATAFPDEFDAGDVTFYRSCVAQDHLPSWSTSTTPLSFDIQLHTNRMEIAGAGMFVDFANKDLHIGCIIPSATQEEVLFSVRPYLFVGLLFSQTMEDNEAIIITGCKQVIKYTGYLYSFQMAGVFSPTSRKFKAEPPHIIAIDAVTSGQFDDDLLIRDLNKAYIGFSGIPGSTPPAQTITTGGWGCGAFGGNVFLKFLQQWMAISEAHKVMLFSTFGKTLEHRELSEIVKLAKEAGYRVCDIHRIISEFGSSKRADKFQKFLLSRMTPLPPPPTQPNAIATTDTTSPDTTKPPTNSSE
ncbi:Poly (ADP-ribose) glycohydrolase (PARG) [Pelomyxa schiedti]|nr:Poly (ADP-ribose) glycohydrolase (PARG) [Pelomyxa schiedti]